MSDLLERGDEYEFQDGLCEACRNGNVQLRLGAVVGPQVIYRPFTDEDQDKAAADVERWEREDLLVPADECIDVGEWLTAVDEDPDELADLWDSDRWQGYTLDFYEKWFAVEETQELLVERGKPDQAAELEPLADALWVEAINLEEPLRDRVRAEYAMTGLIPSLD